MTSRWPMLLLTLFVLTDCVESEPKPTGWGVDEPAPVEAPNNEDSPPEVEEAPRPKIGEPRIEASEIVGTQWGMLTEGSVGRWVDWTSFNEDGVLSVTRDSFSYDERGGDPEVILGARRGAGTWRLEAGVVAASWNNDDGIQESHAFRLTWAPIPRQLLEYEPVSPYGVPAAAERAWGIGGMQRSAENQYQGEWENSISYSETSLTRSLATVVTLNSKPCQVSITLTALEERNGEVQEGTERFEYKCSLEDIGTDGWTAVQPVLDVSWSEMISNKGVRDRFGYNVGTLMEFAFQPMMWRSPGGEYLFHRTSQPGMFDAFEPFEP